MKPWVVALLGLVAVALVSPLAHADTPSVYVVAVPASAEHADAAREFGAFARAALAESEGFRVREPDAQVRGELADAREAHAAGLLALRRGRQAYLAFELDTAQAAFEQALAQLDQAWAVLDSPEPVAQSLMYLGACHALAGDKSAARRVFARYHVAYGALSPDERVFNPQVMVEWREARRELGTRQRAKLVIEAAPEAELSLDGRVLGLGGRTIDGLPPGEHVLRASVVGGEPALARVTLKSRGTERVTLETPPERPELAALLAGAGDPGLAQELATALSVDALAVISVSGDGGQVELALTAYGAVTPAPTEPRSVAPELEARLQGARTLVAQFLDRVASQAHALARPVAVVAEEEPSPFEHPPAEEPKRRWYKKGWVWVVIGGVVLAGGATALALSLTKQDETPRAQPEGGTLTLEF